MDGLEVARRVRQRPGSSGVTLVALSGWGQEEDRRRSRDAGMDYHMVKPLDLEELTRLLMDTAPEAARSAR
jgi:CheY-like chemotaxis protein